MRKAIVWIACAALAACSLQPIRAEPGIGRPGAPLDTDRCQATWKMASPKGEPLSATKAAPYVFDFEAMDVDQDGKISEYEFKDGYRGGWVKDVSTVTNSNRSK
jgi:hypothetical protein